MLRRHGAMSGAGGVGRTCVYVPCLDKGGPLSAPQTGDSDGITRGAWVRLPHYGPILVSTHPGVVQTFVWSVSRLCDCVCHREKHDSQ